MPPVPHCWLQHSAPLVQARPSVTHWLAPQTPEMHVVVQQSVGDAHFCPSGVQVLISDAQVFVALLHKPEQQSAPVWHSWP